MEIQLTPYLLIGLVLLIVGLKHVRRMEAMRLGLPDRRAERRAERRLRRRSRHLADAGEPARLTHEEREELQDLRQRVQVLERIATDGRSARELADEIEALRAQPLKELN